MDTRAGLEEHRALKMTVVLRRTVGSIYVVIERLADDTWKIEVSDAISDAVSEEERREAIEEVLKEMSTIRSLLWKELGNG